MAQTWRITPLKVAVFRAADALLLPARLVRSKYRSPEKIGRILVLEPWLIGDVVIATAALKALRGLFPDAHITLLAKEHARELLEHSPFVDEIVVHDLPWTARTGKYDLKRYDFSAIKGLLSRLEAMKFDLSVDARMDLRSNLLTWVIGAKHRIGFDYGGGSSLLTHAVPAAPNAKHRVDDWLDLVRAAAPFAAPHNRDLALTLADGCYPELTISDFETTWANDWLSSHGISGAGPLVAIHAGASDPRRRWPLTSYRKVARHLQDKWNAEILFLPEPNDLSQDFDLATATGRVSLREMMALMSRTDLVLCNDSGPMHIADALDVPVVAIFMTGNPRWHRPSRPYQRHVGEGTGHDFLIPPTEEQAIQAADALLESARGAHAGTAAQ
jgi:heptosyltransferase-2